MPGGRLHFANSKLCEMPGAVASVSLFDEAKKGRDMLVALQADPDVAASGLIKLMNRLGLSFDGLFADVEIVADTLKDLLATKQQQAEAAASSMKAFQDALKGKGKRKS